MSAQLITALQDCVSVMERELNGLAVIQPELMQAREALLSAMEPPAWTGEGLPPVGLECEAFWPGDTNPEWCKFQFLFVGKLYVIAMVDGEEADYMLGDFARKEVKFRNIRTPEQIAAEERENAIIRLATLLAGHQTAWETQRETAAYLYDVGYRKVEGGKAQRVLTT